MHLGIWKNFEELEQSLTLSELDELLKSSRKEEYSRRKFAAALKGFEMPEWEDQAVGETSTFEDVKRRAEAKLRGVSEEALGFEEIGFKLIEE